MGFMPGSSAIVKRRPQDMEADEYSFSLLATEVGLDCAGAVQFTAVGEEERLDSLPSGAEDLTGKQIEAWLNCASGRSYWPDADVSFRPLALGGAQPKIGVRLTGDTWQTPIGKSPSTHIIKLPPRSHPDDSPLEALCQTAASKLGLDAAPCRVERFGRLETVVYERFDRDRTKTGEVHRRHHEMLTQGMGRWHGAIYQYRGGPDLDQVVGFLQASALCPEQEVKKFMDAILYHQLIGNTDGNAEGFSICLENGAISLAPLYDMSSSMPYQSLQSEAARNLYPAMWPRSNDSKSGSDPTVYDLDDPRLWEDFAERNHINLNSLFERKRELASGLTEAFESAQRELPEFCREHQVVVRMMEMVQHRAQRCLEL